MSSRTGHRHIVSASFVALAAAVTTLVGCGGDGGGREKESSATTSSRPTTSSTATVPATTTTAAEPGGGTAPTVRGGGGSAGRAGPTTPSTKAAGSAGATGAPSASGTAAARPGRYRYASTGTFSTGVGAEEQQRTGESILTVDPPAGADQHSLRQGEARSTEQVLRYQADGIYIVMLKVTEQGLVKEFRPSPPVLAFPFGAPVGHTWSWRVVSTDGRTTVDANFRVERTESVQVGPDTVPTVVVQATLVTSGDLISRGTQTLWVAEKQRLTVREQSVTDGTFGAFRFRSTAEERLFSLTPS